VAFLKSREFEVFYGGAKGGGKSDVLLMGSLQQIEKARYKALLLRRTFPELQELIDRSHRIFPRLQDAPVWDGEKKRWVFSNRNAIQFGYALTKEDIYRYHGGEYAYIGHDELADQADERVWLMLMAECRCPNPDVLLMMRASGNPGKAGHQWVRRRFVDVCGTKGERVYRYQQELADGRVHTLTRRFIPAKVTDNPIYANDLQYLAQLNSLPEVLRRQLLDGDWTAGTGAALDELDPSVHWCDPFQPPDHWYHFAGFDWGFAHPWVFVHAVSDEDGNVFVLDTVRGRRHRPDEIAERIRDRIDVRPIRLIASGHDSFSETRARGENTPTIAEQFAEQQLILHPANTARRFGLNTIRRYLAHRGMPPGMGPKLKFCRTPGNDWLFQQLQTISLDPDDPEDTLKADADEVTGQGGDDGYDALRYLLASRPMAVASTGAPFSAWATAALAREARERRTVRPPEEREGADDMDDDDDLM
jgi:hypothetical protein